MIIEDAWKVLGIDPTKDENEIKTAYRTLVVKTNPEDDPEGFKMLREAYDMAMNSLNAPAESKADEDTKSVEKDEVDLYIDEADKIYRDLFSRIDEDKWREWLKAPIVNELDTADIVREKFLAYCMGHFEYPNKVWKLFDSVFNYRAEHASLAEVFPNDYLNFIDYQTENDSFIDYSKITRREAVSERLDDLGINLDIDSKPGIYEPEAFDVPVDLYIKEISFMHGYIDRILRVRYSDYMTDDEKIESEEERKRQEEEAIDILKAMLNHIRTFDVISPIELAGFLRVFFFEDRFDDAIKLAESIIENRIFDSVGVYEYATAMFVLIETLNIQGKLTPEVLKRIDELADKQLEILSESIMTLQVKGQVKYYEKDYENASEYFIRALDINSRNSEAIMLLRRSSDSSIDYYNSLIDEGTITEEQKIELAWSYFRMEKVDDTLKTLDIITPNDGIFYGYNNLYGRSYYNKENYEKAYPYIVKWVEMIEAMDKKKQAGETLSKKDEERLTRMGFCYYMMASCAEKTGKTDEAIQFYKKCIDRTAETFNDINELMFYQESYGKLLLEKGDYQGAMEVWNSMIERTDHCIPAYVQRQKTAFEMRDAQLVIDDYYNITRDVPQYPEAYELAAKVFNIYNQSDDVEAVYKRAEEAGVVTDKLRLIKARNMLRKRNDEEALEIYKAIETSIDNDESDIKDEVEIVEIYADLANIYMNRKDESGRHTNLHDAEEYIKKGRQLDRDNKRLYWLETDIKEWQGEAAESVYEKMLELFPEDENVDYEYGEYFRRKKDIDRAIQYYNSCLQKNSSHRSVNNKLMDIYQNRYSNTEDREDYNKAVEYAGKQLENDEDDYYYVERALLYLDGYEFDKTFEDASRAIEKNPKNVYAHNARGLARLRAKRYKEALEYFNKAIEIMEKGETSNPYINAAKCCECLGEYEKGIHYLEICKREFDYNPTLVSTLARLNSMLRRYDIADEHYRENADYYTRKRKETNNTWYDLRILETMYRRAETKLLSGNYSAVERIIQEEINVFLRENGYLAVDTYLKPKGNERKRIAELFMDLADFFNYSRRYNKKAIHYYEEALKYWSMEDTNQKKGVLGILGVKKELPRPELNIDNKEDLEELSRLYMCLAYILCRSGDRAKCAEYANRSLECIIKGYGSIERYLDYPALRALRIRVISMDSYLRGDKKKAEELLHSLNDIDRCYHCHHGCCYEEFLFLARIYELDGDKELAIEYYKKAFQSSPDDAEVYQALKDLEK